MFFTSLKTQVAFISRIDPQNSLICLWSAEGVTSPISMAYGQSSQSLPTLAQAISQSVVIWDHGTVQAPISISQLVGVIQPRCWWKSWNFKETGVFYMFQWKPATWLRGLAFKSLHCIDSNSAISAVWSGWKRLGMPNQTTLTHKKNDNISQHARPCVIEHCNQMLEQYPVCSIMSLYPTACRQEPTKGSPWKHFGLLSYIPRVITNESLYIIPPSNPSTEWSIPTI